MRIYRLFSVLLTTLLFFSVGTARAEDHTHDHNDSPVHVDLGLGFAYGQNGFIVPAPLQGGREDGKGAWFHLGLHPKNAEWFEINCGADFLNKDEGNWSWGVHCGAVFFLNIRDWAHLGLGPFMGYHGERRLLTLSGQKLTRPETLHSF